MDREDLDRLVVQHEAFPPAVARLLHGVDPRTLRARETERRWSPLEILAHLADEETEDFRPRAQAAAAGGSLPGAIDPAGWVVQRAYNDKDPLRVLADFESERRRSCAWLRGLDPAVLGNALEHPRLGRMRCGDFIAAWRMHDLLHLRQLGTALAILTARELEDWRIDYAGQIPSV
jgi:hypothetical protein